MCGIGGVRTYNPDVPILPEELKMLACQLEHRGKQATGFALMTAGKIHILKSPEPAWSFVAAKATDDFLDEFLTPETTIALVHTRWATVGNPNTNANNHPIFKGHCAIIHNGSISNHHSIFNTERLERSCETDSDVIRGLLDKYGMTEEGLKVLSQMSGSAAIAAMSEDDPDVLLLGRSGSPLAYGGSKDKLWWASEMGAIQAAVKPFSERHGLPVRKSRPDIDYYTMPDNTVYLLRSDGSKVTRRQFNACTYYTAPDYSHGYESYGAKMRGWNTDHARDQARAATTRALPATTTPVDPAKGFTHKIAPCQACGLAHSVDMTKGEKFTGFICSNNKCKKPLDALDHLPADKLEWRNI